MILKNIKVTWFICLLFLNYALYASDELIIVNNYQEIEYRVEWGVESKELSYYELSETSFTPVNKLTGNRWIKIILLNKNNNALDFYILTYSLSGIKYYTTIGKAVNFEMRYGIHKPPHSHLYNINLAHGSSIELFIYKEGKINFNIYSKNDIIALAADNANYYNNEIIWQSIFFGILLFQIFYALLQWSFLRKHDYLYYIGYMVVIGVYFMSKYEYLFSADIVFSQNPTWWIYLDKSLPILSYFFYYRFARYFLNLPVTMPDLNGHVKAFEWFLLCFVIFNFAFISIIQNTILEDKIFIIISAICAVFTVYAITRFALSGNILSWFILSGAAFVTIGSLTSLILFLTGKQSVFINLNPLFANQAGIILELFAFTTGLAYKALQSEKERITAEEKLKNEKIIRAIELENAVVNTKHLERARIASDLHDDIGSGLSSIKLMSEAAKIKYKESIEEINKISVSAGELLDNVKDIIWIMNSGNEMLDELIYHFRNYSMEYLEAAGINCRIDIPETIPEIILSSTQKRNIFLSLKECLHNIVKHSGATTVEIQFLFDENLDIRISDNGIGFDEAECKQKGNGLSNIDTRMNKINGSVSYTIKGGTRVLMSCPIKSTENVSKGTLH